MRAARASGSPRAVSLIVFAMTPAMAALSLLGIPFSLAVVHAALTPGATAVARPGLQLVIEFRARRRIAVRQIETPDNQPADRRFDVAAVHVIRIPGQTAAGLYRLGAACQDRHPVPA